MAMTRSAVVLSILAFAACSAATSQTQPSVVPVPIMNAAAGIGNASTTVCSSPILSTDGSNFGDGCPATQARMSAPQGAAVDRYGNIYFADYNDKQVRVVYKGGAQLAAAITAANSNYKISASRNAPAPTPVVGDVYTLAGVGAGTSTFTSLGTGFPCANYSTGGQPAGIDSLGDGCPGASAPIAARDVKPDSDGNLFIADYTNGRIRVFCVNCAAGTMAQKLITAENPTVTAPANGSLYTVAGFANGYRDGYIGYNTASNASSATAAQAISLLRDPTGVSLSPNDDVFIADNQNNAERVLYNGGAVAKAILQAQGTSAPTVGFVYTIAGAGCVSAATNKTGSVSSANSCLTTAGSDTPATGNTVGSGAVWSTYVDLNQNVFYTDATNNRVKVIYGGIANPLTITGTLHVGYTYSFAGQGAGVAGAANGVPPSQIVLDSAQSIGGDSQGNIFFADYMDSFFYEVYGATGITALIGANSPIATPAAGAACNGAGGGPAMSDAFYEGCPATQAKISSPRGPIVADASGTLYFGDAIGYFVRSMSYNQVFPATPVGTPSASQPYAFTFLAPLTIASTAITPSSDFSDGGNSTCTAAAYLQSATCVQNVKFTPSVPAARAGSVSLKTATGVAGYLNIGGAGTGSAVVVAPGTLTTLTSAYSANGVAVDSNSLYLTDATSKSAVKLTGGTPTTLSSGFTSPQGIAVDGAGNVFIGDAGATSLTEVPVTGSSAFTLNTAVSSPAQLATGLDGTLYVADSGNNRVLAFGPGSKTAHVLGFTGLSSPRGVAVDGAGRVYTTSGSTVQILSADGLTQTQRATPVAFSSLGVDAAGAVYGTDGANVVTVSPSASATTIYADTSAKGVALDGSGNLYIGGTGGVVESQRTVGFYKFPSTSGSTTITVSSIGTKDAPSTSYTSTNTTDYTVTSSSSNGCSGALTAGSSCGYNAAYSQVTLGAPTDVLTFSGGTTFTLASISLTPAITVSASPATLTYGNKEILSATVYGPGNTGGTVTFYTNGNKVGTAVADANGLASFSYTPPVGAYTVSADYTPSGATTASVTTKASASFTVTAATPGLTLQVTPPSGYTTTTFTATATLTSTGSTPTGTVKFFSGTNQVGSGTVNASGVATATFTALAVGTDCITAQYVGDSNYNTVTTGCTNVTVAAGFSVSATSSQLTFQSNYQEAQTFLNITTGGRSDTLTFSCTGLPAKLQCGFSPSSVTLGGGSATVQVQMLVANSGATYGAVGQGPLPQARTLELALLPALGLIGFALRRRRRLSSLVLAALLSVLALSATGCGRQDPKTLSQASGTYNFNVVVSSGSSTVQTIPFSVNIP